ncbi:5235fadc-092e-4c39-a221-bb48a75f62c0 [Thermothielavioides terrestris]|uniref:5235fadc-092e-4c39-a221-bb48a75f62c0 n=1 Tax=Thermothielavioides terrestris TaxID=2587410 RepID=A0A446BLD9_9PEZI|nr:5235fadc-092e-4c39-a221-bb48a75f62c0 [Thermothielavioides terrestris]
MAESSNATSSAPEPSASSGPPRRTRRRIIDVDEELAETLREHVLSAGCADDLIDAAFALAAQRIAAAEDLHSWYTIRSDLELSCDETRNTDLFRYTFFHCAYLHVCGLIEEREAWVAASAAAAEEATSQPPANYSHFW